MCEALALQKNEMLSHLGGNKFKIVKGTSRVMFIVDSDFRDNHRKMLKISR